ncbi:MAG: multicopper oxidase family protein [Candidatus Nanopelagicales bacterium]
MTDLTRREAMALAALSGSAVALGASPALAGSRRRKAPVDTLPTIPTIRSRNGILRATLDATPGSAVINGVSTKGLWTYSGRFVGPCLRVSPGDKLELTVRNQTPVPVNTHFHGCWVDPSGDADNVFVDAEPGGSLTSRLTFPATHDGGLFWYHPHVHGYTNESVWNGLSGPLIVSGGVEAIPQYQGCRERLLVFKGFALDPKASSPTMLSVDSAGASDTLFTVNGALAPIMALRPGETQIWRMANTGNDGFLRVSLEGHKFTVLSMDGAQVFAPFRTPEVLLVPGARAEVAVTGADKPGSYALRTLGFNNGRYGEWLPQVLATVQVGGRPGATAKAPKVLAARPSWLDEKPVRRRLFTLSEAFVDGAPQFLINGEVFDHQDMHTPFEVQVGTVEEWVVRNAPSVAAGGAFEGHPFHIHVNHFAVVGTGKWDPETGKVLSHQAVKPPGLRDAKEVGPREYVVLRMKFRRFTGKTVFHCHILFHEDMGMMGSFAIVDRPPADDGHMHH